jgi:hypothetical protein
MVGLGALTAGLTTVLSMRLLLNLAAGLALLLVIARPHWGLMGILLLWSLEMDLFRVGPLSIIELTSAALFVPMGIQILRDRGVWIARVPEVRIVAAIGLMVVLSTAWASAMYPPAPFGSDTALPLYRDFIKRLVFLVLFLYFVRTRAQVRQMLFLVLMVVLFAAGTALYPFVFTAAPPRAYARWVGIAENPNSLAYVSVFGASLLWFFRMEGPTSRWRSCALPAVLCLLLTAVLAGSRNGLLQVLIFGALAVHAQKTLSATRKMYAILLGGIFAVLVLVAVPSTQWLRATDFSTSNATAGGKSAHNRLTTVQTALELAVRYPVLGVGPGNFRWRHQEAKGNYQSTHNSYLWALMTAGPLFLGLYLLLFRRVYRRLRALEALPWNRNTWLARALRINLVLFLAYSAFADHWLSIFCYLFVGFGVVLSRLPVETPWFPRVAARPATV